MPIYEYRCPTCGEKFETLVRFGSDDLVHCPRCGSDTPQRMISLVSHMSSSGSTPSYSSSSSCAAST